jgi:hypothetical protein
MLTELSPLAGSIWNSSEERESETKSSNASVRIRNSAVEFPN